MFPRYFGVFDGHGGSKVAAYAANNLHRFIVKREEYKENREEAISKLAKRGFDATTVFEDIIAKDDLRKETQNK